MTKLEREIKEALLDKDIWQDTKMQSAEAFAKAAAEVAKKYIEKAYEEAYDDGHMGNYEPEEWLKKNGII